MKNKDLHNSFVPIYQTLFEYYKQGILTQQFLPTTKIDSITNIQTRFHVSRETAKQVLKKLAEAGLIMQKPGKGSFVADLRSCQKKWGVIVPFFSAQMDTLIHHLQNAASKNNRKLEHFIDYNNWQEEIRLVGTLIQERYEAVIIIPTFDESKTASFYQKLVSGGTTITLLDHTMMYSGFSCAIQSYDLGVEHGVQYLLGKTTGTLALIKNQLWHGRNMIQEVMELTFSSIIKKDEPCREAIVCDSIKCLTKQMILDKNITGFFCCDDSDAVRVVGRLKEWGFRIPAEIRLVSYGNTELARFFTPSVTSIDPHYEQMAGLTAEIIKDRKRTAGGFQQHILQPELVIRET
jgi:DNA-binding LacI/PurR family transcriptional regulator